MLRSSIGRKTLLLLLVVSLLPLTAIHVYWFRSQQSTLRQEAASRQTILASDAANQVNQFITNKINTLIIYSQTAGVQDFDISAAQANFTMLIKQDSDLERVSLVDTKGDEKIVLNQQGTPEAPVNVKDSDAFKAATFLSGKEYISEVFFEESNPTINIAVPLITFEKRQELSNLSTAEPGLIRGTADIKGLLIATVNLNNLWQNVLSQRLGDSGYAYVVDSLGRLIAHPNGDLIKSQPDLRQNEEVRSFLSDPKIVSTPKRTMSENKQAVLSTHVPVALTGWAVIAEEPLDSIFAAALRVADRASVIFVVSLMLIVSVSYLLSHQFTKPIKQLAERAARISRGDFDARVSMNRTDEVGTLATAFNIMAGNVQGFIRSLRTEKNKLNVVLNSVGEGIIAIDVDGRVVVVNMAAAIMVGKLPQDIVGKPVSEVFSWTQNNQHFQITLNKTNVSQEVDLNGQGNRRHYLDLIVNKIEEDPNGIQAIITFRDKTKEKELEIMKVDFVSMAAHELRTPMTSIRGYLSLIAQDPESGLTTTSARYLKRAQKSSVQLIGLINNLLNVAKIERGALGIHRQVIDWNKLIRDSVDDQAMAAHNKSIDLSYGGPGKEIYIKADELAVREVAANLISNAIKYTNRGGHIKVSVTERGDEVITSVSDDGTGIPANAIPHLFTKFYRVREELDSGNTGSGLGLYISKSIVEMHGGKIWVESEDKKGSTFIFSLPIHKPDAFEVLGKREEGVTSKRGWITKSITR